MMFTTKETNSGVKPHTDMPPNPQILYGWGKQEGSCPKCGLKDFGGSTLEMHIKQDHPRTPQGTYSCWICSYTFKRQGQFVKHHRLGHAGEKMACWVCGEKNWASTALIYNHIKRNHPGYKKGTAREYFAKLNNSTSTALIYNHIKRNHPGYKKGTAREYFAKLNNSTSSVMKNLKTSKQTYHPSSSYFDSLSDSASMDSYYSENSTDIDDDGAPIFRSDISDEHCEDLEGNYLVDADGAPIIESLTPLPITRTAATLTSYDCSDKFQDLETEHPILGI